MVVDIQAIRLPSQCFTICKCEVTEYLNFQPFLTGSQIVSSCVCGNKIGILVKPNPNQVGLVPKPNCEHEHSMAIRDKTKKYSRRKVLTES